ncbi:oligopeptidase A [Fistulifera solaris]|uniref:oligopeptidase A n=1 Tax=Fistulifera solaris TaxID=1519565 RepID=A0A1Z5J7P7_FISSO|nr:oligopeptidase A [Fistulifera solaris]|eukprot:GAX10024.1 oligopeptidase A [Fistulifera solaris]
MKPVLPFARLMFLGSVAVRAFSRSSTVRSFYRTSALAMTTSVTTTTNPLLQQEGLPRFAEIDPQDLTPAVEELLKKLEHDFQSLETKLSASTDNIEYESVLPEVEKMQFPIGYTWGVAGHLNAVKNGDELREAYQANQPKIVKALTQFKQSKPVFAALSAIEEKQKVADDDSFYTQQKKRAVENSLRSMKLGGVGLEGEAKETFNTMKMRLAELATKFSNNVLDETKAFSLTLTDASQMEGVPDSAKAMWANAHVNFVKQSSEELDVEKGPWRITLDMPSYIAVMSHMKDRTVREQVYKAYLQRASSDERNNTPIIYETLKLKNSMAKMLGFDNYAEQSLSSKMAPSVEAVRELTDLIAAKALPAAEKELVEITALAREKGGDEYSELKHWDVTYWSERLKESKFELTEEETRPYFALPAVLDGMFQLVSRIFDIEVQSADGEEQVWHPDVRFFKVYDKESGKHIASFFLDPYSRPENKRGGAWMNVCIGKSEACGRDTPVAYLTCNGSPPVGSKPSLMTFREVTTLFHEFGHGLQHMLTTATVGDVAGISGVEWDAVELPSQFMENWLFDKSTVYGFAKHWETGAPMPEEMFDKLEKQRMYGTGMATCRQLVFGQIDLELHSAFDAEAGEKGEGESIFDVQRRISSKYVPYMMPLPEDRFLCSFSHIFAGGYAAGYYSYKWAEVMSADAFAAFEEVGLDNEEEVKKVGRKFRDTVLSLGGGVDPMEVFKQFRGREPRPGALLRHNGLE